MKKNQKVFLVILSTLTLFLTACTNFNNGSDLINELDAILEYVNKMYTDVTITALNSYTEAITPPAGNYNTKYKKGDVIDLNLSIKSSYQFVEWKATPADAIEFSSSASLLTTATILKDDNPITIEPIVCERPTVSFLPANVVAVEKNSAVVITFSHELNLTDDITLDLIKIVNEYGTEIQSQNFLPPVLDETKKVVTFDPNPENLISFEGNTLGITVKVPAVFNYLYENEKICLEKDVEYSYKVNQETLDKLELTFENPDANAGTANLDGEVKLNLGQTQTLKFSVLKGYYFKEWQVLDSQGQTLTKETYEHFFKIDDVTKSEITIVVNKPGKGFVIKPIAKEYPNVIASSPAYSIMGVDAGNKIKVIFDKPMSISSIYWTKEEILSLKGNNTDFKYSEYKVDNSYSNGEELYYCYSSKDEEGTVHKYYKNIEIKRKEGSRYKSLLDGNYYDCPYFESETELVIPTAKKDAVPTFSNIEVLIKGFFDIYGTPLEKWYMFTYSTNSSSDNENPKVSNLTGNDCITIKGYKGLEYNNEQWNMVLINDGENIVVNTDSIPTDLEIDRQEILNNIKQCTNISELNSLNIFDTKKIEIRNIKISDDSALAYLISVLTPVDNNIYSSQSDEIIYAHYPLNGKSCTAYMANDDPFSIDLSDYDIEGVYEVSFYIEDAVGNKIKLENLVPNTPNNKNRTRKQWVSFCIIDNIYGGEATYTFNSDFTCTVTAESGYYYLIGAKTTEDKIYILESNNIKSPDPTTHSVILNPDYLCNPNDLNIQFKRMCNYYIIPYDEFGNKGKIVKVK